MISTGMARASDRHARCGTRMGMAPHEVRSQTTQTMTMAASAKGVKMLLLSAAPMWPWNNW